MKNTVNIRILAEDHKRLKILAAKKGITITALVTYLSKLK